MSSYRVKMLDPSKLIFYRDLLSDDHPPNEQIIQPGSSKIQIHNNVLLNPIETELGKLNNAGMPCPKNYLLKQDESRAQIQIPSNISEQIQKHPTNAKQSTTFNKTCAFSIDRLIENDQHNLPTTSKQPPRKRVKNDNNPHHIYYPPPPYYRPLAMPRYPPPPNLILEKQIRSDCRKMQKHSRTLLTINHLREISFIYKKINSVSLDPQSNLGKYVYRVADETLRTLLNRLIIVEPIHHPALLHLIARMVCNDFADFQTIEQIRDFLINVIQPPLIMHAPIMPISQSGRYSPITPPPSGSEGPTPPMVPTIREQRTLRHSVITAAPKVDSPPQPEPETPPIAEPPKIPTPPPLPPPPQEAVDTPIVVPQSQTEIPDAPETDIIFETKIKNILQKNAERTPAEKAHVLKSVLEENLSKREYDKIFYVLTRKWRKERTRYYYHSHQSIKQHSSKSHNQNQNLTINVNTQISMNKNDEKSNQTSNEVILVDSDSDEEKKKELCPASDGQLVPAGPSQLSESSTSSPRCIPQGKLCYDRTENTLTRYFKENQRDLFLTNTNNSESAKNPKNSDKSLVYALDRNVSFSQLEMFDQPEDYLRELELVTEHAPKDFADFYQFVSGYQISQNHNPVSFNTFLLMYNTDRMEHLLNKYIKHFK